MSKNSTRKKDFYTPVLNLLEHSTNLKEIQKKLNLSKQELNYYLRQLKNKGLISHKGKGWYEVKDSSKNSTNHDILLTKDTIRGHAYVWDIKLPQEMKGWENRIALLEKHNIHFKIVGAKNNTPRIKILGRKVWLCNKSIRIYDKKNQSYYGINAIESRKLAFQEFLLIVGVLERKLNINLRNTSFTWNKEHYALIKNDLAIQENRKGNLWHIEDENGEWLIIDDSLNKGGELENIGKKSFETNIPMTKWWNDMKKTNFEVTPSFINESIGGIIQIQQMNADNIVKHQKVLDEMLSTLKSIRKSLDGR